jgi:hypothetical protein
MKNLSLALVFISLAILACSGYWETTSPTVPKTPILATFQPQIPSQDTNVTIYAPGDYVVCNTGIGLNVRGRPADEGRILYVIEPGTKVHVREWSQTGNGWAMIKPANWVNGDYLCEEEAK